MDSDTTILDAYHMQLTECCLNTVCNRVFYLFPKLSRWLWDSVQTTDQRFVTRLELLVVEVHETPPNRPKWVENILQNFRKGDECCLKVFCILVNLKLGHLIKEFSRHVQDASLPRSLDQLKKHFKAATQGMDICDHEIERYAEEFDAAQHSFCAHVMGRTVNNHLDEDAIPPITVKQRINEKGGIATEIWRIEIPKDYVAPRLEPIMSKSSVTRDGIQYFQFALKSFTDHDYWEREIEAFTGLSTNEHIIKYLGDYVHVRPPLVPGGPSITTYNILLEFGERDLDDIFHTQPLPFTGFIESFWFSLFDVAKAVRDIHSFSDKTQHWIGCHADIKPDNILIVDGRFKLADPGFARFGKATDSQLLVDGGTITWGAPECHRDKSTSVTPRIDIWSLGCVFSVAASWLVLGSDGVKTFSRFRRDAIRELVEKIQSETPAAFGDHFHDGQEALVGVTEWHKFLRGNLRRIDTITDQVLDLVDKKMLLPQGTDRISAEELCVELEKIIQKSRPTLGLGSEDFMGKVRHALRALDRQLYEQQPAGQTSVEPNSSRKSAWRRAVSSRPYSGDEIIPHRYRDDGFVHIHTPDLDLHDHSHDLSSGRDSRGHNHTPSISSGVVVTPEETPTKPVPAVEVSCEQVLNLTHRHSHIPKSWSKLKDKVTRHGRAGKDEILLQYIKGRHFKLLVDNAATMVDHWDHTAVIVEAIAQEVAGLSSDGIDLDFTFNDNHVAGSKDVADFVKAVKDSTPVTRASTRTDMVHELKKIFAPYVQEVKKLGGSPMRVLTTVIILTDGRWEAMGQNKREDMATCIVDFVKEIKDELDGQMHERPFTIQFVQLGEDAEVTEILKHLDDDLESLCGFDIVDQVPWNGNFYKIVLGSTVPYWDDMASTAVPDINPEIPQDVKHSKQSSVSSTSRSIPSPLFPTVPPGSTSDEQPKVKSPTTTTIHRRHGRGMIKIVLPTPE